jgi:hypothetical protein
MSQHGTLSGSLPISGLHLYLIVWEGFTLLPYSLSLLF